MKKVFLILGFIIAFLATGSYVSAKTNLLHSITFEKNIESYNIILDTDSMSKVTRKVETDNNLVLELSGVTSSDTVNVLYKGIASINNLVIENSGLNKLKIYISAPDINSATVILQPVSGNIAIAKSDFPVNKIIWTLLVVAILGFVVRKSLNHSQDNNSVLIKHDIKEREIELYRQYKNSLDNPVSLQSKDVKMKSIIKKIDRKIDERLSLLSK